MAERDLSYKQQEESAQPKNEDAPPMWGPEYYSHGFVLFDRRYGQWNRPPYFPQDIKTDAFARAVASDPKTVAELLKQVQARRVIDTDYHPKGEKGRIKNVRGYGVDQSLAFVAVCFGQNQAEIVNRDFKTVWFEEAVKNAQNGLGEEHPLRAFIHDPQEPLPKKRRIRNQRKKKPGEDVAASVLSQSAEAGTSDSAEDFLDYRNRFETYVETVPDLVRIGFIAKSKIAASVLGITREKLEELIIQVRRNQVLTSMQGTIESKRQISRMKGYTHDQLRALATLAWVTYKQPQPKGEQIPWLDIPAKARALLEGSPIQQLIHDFPEDANLRQRPVRKKAKSPENLFPETETYEGVLDQRYAGELGGGKEQLPPSRAVGETIFDLERDERLVVSDEQRRMVLPQWTREAIERLASQPIFDVENIPPAVQEAVVRVAELHMLLRGNPGNRGHAIRFRDAIHLTAKYMTRYPDIPHLAQLLRIMNKQVQQMEEKNQHET